MPRKNESKYILPIPNLKKGTVLKLTNDYFGNRVKGGLRTRRLVFQRQATAYLLSVFTNLRNDEIADAVGYSGETRHSMVSYGIRKIRGYCKFCDDTRKEIIELESKIESCYDCREKI